VPFLGFTVTVTLHVPTFKPLSEVPDTLQNATIAIVRHGRNREEPENDTEE
jgi:hypothetical protein